MTYRREKARQEYAADPDAQNARAAKHKRKFGLRYTMYWSTRTARLAVARARTRSEQAA